MRDVEPVLAAEREVEVVARDARDLLRLEAEQLADAVVLVDDVVADAEVGEARERPAEARGRRAAGACGRPACRGAGRGRAPARRSPRRAGATAKRSSRLGAERLAGSSSGASTLRRSAAWRSRLAAMRRTRRRRGCPARTKPASSFSASASPRAATAGRCASNACGWPAGTGRARWRRRARSAARPSSSATRAHLVGLPDEVGRAADRRDEVGRHLGDRCSPSSSRRGRARRGRRAARPRDRRPRRSAGCSARWVNGEKARTCSISSPKSSTRSGSRPVDGKTSTMPPRTANCPRSSTRSTRS